MGIFMGQGTSMLNGSPSSAAQSSSLQKDLATSRTSSIATIGRRALFPHICDGLLIRPVLRAYGHAVHYPQPWVSGPSTRVLFSHSDSAPTRIDTGRSFTDGERDESGC